MDDDDDDNFDDDFIPYIPQQKMRSTRMNGFVNNQKNSERSAFFQKLR